MNLSSLSLNDLRYAQNVLEILKVSGAIASDGGLEPFFDLTPGQPVTMTLGTLFEAEPAIARATADVPPPAPPVGLASQTEDFGPRLGWDELDREVYLTGYTGGAHDLGAWGELTLLARGSGGTEFRSYRAVEPWRDILDNNPLYTEEPFVRIRDPETGWTADLPIEPLPEAAVAGDTVEVAGGLIPPQPVPGEDGGEGGEDTPAAEPEQPELPAVVEVALSAAPAAGDADGGSGASAPPVAATEAPDAIDPPPLSASGVSGQARPVAPPATLTDKFKPAFWTADEDAKAIRIAADVYAKDGSIKDAATAVSTALGRPFEGTKFRLLNKLKDPIAAELAQRRSAAIRRETASTPAPQDDAPLVAIPPQGSDALTVHLLGMTRKGGWTIERDEQLISLAVMGWKPPEIATELGLSSARDVSLRFDLLTGLTDTLDGTKKRSFERDAVLAKLTQLLAPKAAE